jgi:hypothetical protein
MKSRYLSLAAIVIVVVAVFLFWNGPHTAHGSGQNIVVLCSSCTLEGLPQTGSLILMDENNGDIWIYSDAAMEGKEKPIQWGKLVMGQPVVRAVH